MDLFDLDIDDSLFENDKSDREKRLAKERENAKSYKPLLQTDYWYRKTHPTNAEEMIPVLIDEYMQERYAEIISKTMNAMLQIDKPSTLIMSQLADILCLSALKVNDNDQAAKAASFISEQCVNSNLADFSLKTGGSVAPGALYNASQLLLKHGYYPESLECILATIKTHFPFPKYKEQLNIIIKEAENKWKYDELIAKISDMGRFILQSLNESALDNAEMPTFRDAKHL